MSHSLHSLQPVTARDLGVAFRDHTVFEGIDFVVAPGRRVGLIGENGVGKSTLLRAVAGALPSRAVVTGSVTTPDDRFLIGQEPPFSGADTIADVMARTLRPLRRAVAEIETLAARLDDPSAAQRYAEVLDWATLHDAWDADRRAEMAAGQLGLKTLARQRRIDSLSGGQRTRLALAVAMTRRPDCLLLDEPTNHLDDEAIDLLGGFLKDLPGVVIFASHDRVFLDDLCTDLIDLDPSEFGTDGEGGRRFGGGWTAYSQARAAARLRWEETYRQQQEELDRLRAATRITSAAIAHNRPPRDNDKFSYGFKGARVQSTLARRKRAAQRELEIAEREQVRKPTPPLSLRAVVGTRGPTGRVVQARGLLVDGRLKVSRVDVETGSTLLVTGANGSGKSTLLGVLSGRVRPTSGTVEVTARLVRELLQDVIFPDPSRSARQVYADGLGELAEQRPLRELGILHPSAHSSAVGLLSVGQRRRLGLALALAAGPDLLLLDEPTNHISLALAEELEAALQVSPGAVVVASHDRWLRRRWLGEELRLEPWTLGGEPIRGH